MDNLGADDSKIATISDDYIRNLEPETQRYDITIASDFVISVLPNGIKTWAFIYDFQGRHRRKTLGVFPDMSAAEARAALEKSRDAIVRMDEPTIPPDEKGMTPAVLGGGAYVPKHEPSGSRALLWSVVLIIAALIAAAIWWFLIADHATDTNSLSRMDSSRPFSSTSTTSAQKPEFVVGTNRADDNANESPPANSGNDDNGPAAVSSAPPPAPEQTTTPATSPPPAQENSSSGDSESGASATGNPSTNRATESAARTVDSRVTSTSSRSDVSLSTNSGNGVSQGNRSADAGNSSTTMEGATAFGGRVARSRLTSGMDNLEPVDTVGPELSYKNSGVTRVFYFTELREFSDGKVMHRWELNGEVTDIVYLNVKKSWRWRTYSNKDITPGLTGEWKVSTIDATGTVLDTETFTYGYQ